jgi:hypothetical protein
MFLAAEGGSALSLDLSPVDLVLMAVSLYAIFRHKRWL